MVFVRGSSRDEGKLSSTVLRGAWAGDRSSLPGTVPNSGGSDHRTSANSIARLLSGSGSESESGSKAQVLSRNDTDTDTDPDPGRSRKRALDGEGANKLFPLTQRSAEQLLTRPRCHSLLARCCQRFGTPPRLTAIADRSTWGSRRMRQIVSILGYQHPCLRSAPGSAARISIPTKLGYSLDCFGNADLRLISADRTTENQRRRAFRPIGARLQLLTIRHHSVLHFSGAALAVRSPRGQRGGRKRLAPGRGCSFLQRGSRRRQIITISSRTASIGGNKLNKLFPPV